jgi:hypothetical protein
MIAQQAEQALKVASEPEPEAAAVMLLQDVAQLSVQVAAPGAPAKTMDGLLVDPGTHASNF